VARHLRANAEALRGRPSALLSVCLAADGQTKKIANVVVEVLRGRPCGTLTSLKP